MDLNKIKEAAQGYEKDMHRFPACNRKKSGRKL